MKSLILSFQFLVPSTRLTIFFLRGLHSSQQSSKEEYKPWKWGATARYHASHTKTIIITNEEVRPKIQQAIGPYEDPLTIVKRRKLNGMVMSPVNQVLPKPSCKAQWKGEEDKTERWRGGKATSGNGQAWSSPSPRGQWRTGKNGGNWLWNHLWCPDDPRG